MTKRKGYDTVSIETNVIATESGAKHFCVDIGNKYMVSEYNNYTKIMDLVNSTQLYDVLAKHINKREYNDMIVLSIRNMLNAAHDIPSENVYFTADILRKESKNGGEKIEVTVHKWRRHNYEEDTLIMYDKYEIKIDLMKVPKDYGYIW